MRPWKIVLAGAIAAILAAAAMLWPSLSVVRPEAVGTLVLSRLPAVVAMLLAVYALVAIVSTASGLIAAAVDLRRALGRIEGVSQAAAALDWLAAFDETALRPLAPRVTLSNAARRRTTILASPPFDPRRARAEAAHLYYIWLARTHSLGALVGLAALAALGLAQAYGAAPFLPTPLPAGPAAVVLLGLLLLVLLGRCAVDVTTDPLIDAMARLPWEQADAGQLRLVAELLEAARLDPGASGRAVATAPRDVLERLAIAFEDGSQALATADARLWEAADALGTAVRSATDALAAAGERLAGIGEGDRRALTGAAERLSQAAETIGDASRAAVDAAVATLRKDVATLRSEFAHGTAPDAKTAALQAAVEALTAELQRDTGGGRLAGIGDEDRRALTDAADRLSQAAETIGAASRVEIDTLTATLRDGLASARAALAADEAKSGALQAAVEELTRELRQAATLVGGAKEVATAARPPAAAAEFARELRKLLEEI